MSIRKKIESNIKRKYEEIQELNDKLRAAESYVQALQDTLKHLPRDDGDIASDASVRPGSKVAKALAALKNNNKPMHVTEILKALGEEETRENRASLSGSLGAYVRDGKIFTRPGPNLFGLAEWNQPEREDFPDDFGTS